MIRLLWLRFLVLLLLVCTMFLLLLGCGTTLTQKFNIANEFARSASHNSMPLFRTWCDNAIDKCRAEGLNIKERHKCKGEVACKKARRVVIKTANAVHIGVKIGVYYLIIKDQAKAEAMFASVMSAVGELKKALQQAGFLEPLGIKPDKVPPSVPIEPMEPSSRPTSQPTDGG